MKVSMLIQELQACLGLEGDLDVVFVDSEEQVISSDIEPMYAGKLTMFRCCVEGERYVAFRKAQDGDEEIKRVIAIRANDVSAGDDEYLKWYDSHSDEWKGR